MTQMVTNYLDANEKLAKKTLDWYEKATAWTKDTPWAPLCKTQICSASKMLEGSTSMARKLWRIEKTTENGDTRRDAQA